MCVCESVNTNGMTYGKNHTAYRKWQNKQTSRNKKKTVELKWNREK